MKLTTSLIGLAAALSSTTVLASTTVEYHHVLQASFVGTNHLSYQIYAGDELACSNTVDTTEFGDSTFEDQCNDDWKSELSQRKKIANVVYILLLTVPDKSPSTSTPARTASARSLSRAKWAMFCSSSRRLISSRTRRTCSTGVATRSVLGFRRRGLGRLSLIRSSR